VTRVGERESKTMKNATVTSKRTQKKRPAQTGKEFAHVEFTHPTVSEVCIAGTFNDWHTSAADMVALGNGRWVKELTLPPGVYEYRLVGDGEWIADPRAAESVTNPSGGANSILRVP
jgi:1,4-alpha-glucan branching enzyme